MEKYVAQVWKNVCICHVDTTNIVERHWQYIKYTAFKGRINQSITELVHAMIGDSVTRTWMGGTVVDGLNKNKN